MAIELPKFESTYGVALTACGRLKVETSSSGRAGQQHEPRVARYRTTSGAAFLRSWIGGKEPLQLHIDCALQTVFPENAIPKVTHKKADVLKVINPLRGMQIDATIIAHFEIPLSKLPKTGLIRTLAAEEKTSGVSAKLTGATFSLTGAPVRKIRWDIREEKKTVVHVRMEGQRSIIIGDDYLLGSWEWMSDQFDMFVLGGKSDAIS